MKKCYRCKFLLPFNNFHVNKKSEDGYRSDCKECRKKDNKKQKERTIDYRKHNKGYLEVNKKYKENNKEFVNKLKNDWSVSENGKESKKKYYQKNKELITKKQKDIRKKNPEKFIESEKLRRQRPEYKKNHSRYLNKHKIENSHVYAWRSLLRNSLKRLESKKSSTTIKMLGYSADDLKSHLENLFKEGMDWNNYGDWHIDHKKPVSLFSKDTDVSVVNALDNLQPLWAYENLSKSNKFSE